MLKKAHVQSVLLCQYSKAGWNVKGSQFSNLVVLAMFFIFPFSFFLYFYFFIYFFFPVLVKTDKLNTPHLTARMEEFCPCRWKYRSRQGVPEFTGERDV